MRILYGGTTEYLVNALKRTQKKNAPDKETLKVIKKLQSQKRLNNEEFLKVFDKIRKDGPTTNHKSLIIGR
jgi:hypothetical protein